MQQEIPQGSLVLTRHTDPASIKAGDVITYLTEQDSTITHEVIALYPNYEGSGEVAFQTKGTENYNPDPDLVYGSNVVGTVIAHVYLGALPAWAKAHWQMCALIAVALLLIAAALLLLRPSKKEASPQTPQTVT